MGRLLRSTNGETGKTELRGENLNSENIEFLSRSAASTGDDAAAWIQSEHDTRPVRKNLRGNPAVLTREDLRTKNDLRDLLRRMRALYEKIRGIIEKDNGRESF